MRSSSGWRAATYAENDGYDGCGKVCRAGVAAAEALVQTSVVMAQR
ncbi:hypothetical protein SGM_3620 [Streptomyces griseoaurantiacus M045]|uniref:Uncharacterized protein n=1 Tax=Streptomyces griseoaurantiacus M045 TaxID=996637 RepID=F3NKF6_9ACTN|nr:hypothetical protein SGM_3620 [Streptomyces griseoaurantiacus M045]